MSLRSTVVCLLLLGLNGVASANQEAKDDKASTRNVDSGAGPRADPKTFKDKRGPDFTISAVTGSPILFTITLSDRLTGGSVTSMFNRDQLAMIRAILTESRSFALTEEGVGAKRPRITRFFNEDEPGFFVDVSKLGKATQYFVTMKSRNGYITVDCGTLRRGTESAEPPFVDTILARIIEVTAAK